MYNICLQQIFCRSLSLPPHRNTSTVLSKNKIILIYNLIKSFMGTLICDRKTFLRSNTISKRYGISMGDRPLSAKPFAEYIDSTILNSQFLLLFVYEMGFISFLLVLVRCILSWNVSLIFIAPFRSIASHRIPFLWPRIWPEADKVWTRDTVKWSVQRRELEYLGLFSICRMSSTWFQLRVEAFVWNNIASRSIFRKKISPLSNQPL